MPTSPFGKIVAFCVAALLLIICIGTSAYLAYSVTIPPRIVHIRIVTDPANPPLVGVLPNDLKTRVESASPFFEKAAGIRLSVNGFASMTFPSIAIDPDRLRNFIDINTPRDNSDILVAFWPPPPGDQRLGSVLPYRSAAVVRIDPSSSALGSKEKGEIIMVHQLAVLFGVPISDDPHSVMHLPPGGLVFDQASIDSLMDTRMFDFSKGLAAMKRKAQDGVLRSLDRDVRNHPAKNAEEKTSARVRLAELLVRDSQFFAAAEQYRAELHDNPGNLNARLALSQSLARSGWRKEAEDEAREAIKLAPNRAEPHYQLGFALVRNGDPEAAVAEFRKAIEIQPNAIRNHTGLAVAYAASVGEFDEAEHEFQEALKIDPKNSAVLADREYVKILKTRLQAQLEVAEAAVTANPKSIAAHDRLAILLTRLGQNERAMSEVREARKLGPDTWQTEYTLAIALFGTRDYAGAAAALAEAKKLGSGDRPFMEESIRVAQANHPGK